MVGIVRWIGRRCSLRKNLTSRCGFIPIDKKNNHQDTRPSQGLPFCPTSLLFLSFSTCCTYHWRTTQQPQQPCLGCPFYAETETEVSRYLLEPANETLRLMLHVTVYGKLPFCEIIWKKHLKVARLERGMVCRTDRYSVRICVRTRVRGWILRAEIGLCTTFLLAFATQVCCCGVLLHFVFS